MQQAVHVADGFPALKITFPFNRKSRNPETLLPMQLAAATPPFCSWAGSRVTGIAVQQFRPVRMTANTLRQPNLCLRFATKSALCGRLTVCPLLFNVSDDGL